MINESWYKNYNKEGRGHVFKNKGLLFQQLATYRSIVEALRYIEFNNEACILDVGCGSGQSLRQLLDIGYLPYNMFGIDIIKDRIIDGDNRFPNIGFHYGDATDMPYKDKSFDIVMASTLFIGIKDDSDKKIATEMMRVVKNTGHILLIDWRYDYFHKEYKALTQTRIKSLFPNCKVIVQKNGSLIPPIGYFISKNCYQFYFMVHWLFPFLSGQVTTILRNK